MANLDNIISIFKAKEVNRYPSEQDLQRTIDDLTNVKTALAQINVDETTMKKTVVESQDEISSSDSSGSEKKDVTAPASSTLNQTIRNSIEMVNNGGKFTKPINAKLTEENPEEDPPSDSIARRRKKSLNNNPHIVHPNQSFTSLRNSTTITSFPVSPRKSPSSHKLITGKLKLKKTEKKFNSISKQPQNPELGNPAKAGDGLGIISTLFATCRIRSYDNKSHTFEITKPRRVNEHENAHEKSEIVFVVLANGQMALFTSKIGANMLSLGESQ